MNWEKEFDKRFLEYDGDWIKNDHGYCSTATANDIKQFIRKLLKKIKKKNNKDNLR